MQSLGIAIFCYVRPDVSVYLAIPKNLMPSNIRKVVRKLGKLTLVVFLKSGRYWIE